MTDISTLPTKPKSVPESKPGHPQTIPQFAAEFQVAESTVWNWIAAGTLVAVKIADNTRRILPEHKAAWLAARMVAAEAEAASRREKKSA